MDTGPFREWLVVERGLADITSQVLVKRLRHAVKMGLDMALFQQDPQAAAKRYLSTRASAATPHAYNNDVKLLLKLGEFLGHDLRLAYRKPNPTKPKALQDHYVEKLRTYKHPNPRVRRFRRMILALLRDTGLRPSEAASLEIGDLDPVRSTVKVRKPAKRGLVREIPVPRKMWRPRSPMMAYLRHRPTPVTQPQKLLVKDWNHKMRPTEPRPVTLPALRRELNKMSKELGFKVNHTILRHTLATRIYKERGDVLFVKFLLGHSAISSTMVYTEPTEDDLIKSFFKPKRRR